MAVRDYDYPTITENMEVLKIHIGESWDRDFTFTLKQGEIISYDEIKDLMVAIDTIWPHFDFSYLDEYFGKFIGVDVQALRSKEYQKEDDEREARLKEWKENATEEQLAERKRQLDESEISLAEATSSYVQMKMEEPSMARLLLDKDYAAQWEKDHPTSEADQKRYDEQRREEKASRIKYEFNAKRDKNVKGYIKGLNLTNNSMIDFIVERLTLVEKK